MTKFQNSVIAIAGLLALIVGAPFLAAEDAKNPDLLPQKQVKELVANARTPADHVKLAKHFTALAAKYEAEATEHAELADVYRKNPRRPRVEAALAPDTAGHCDRLVQLNRESARAALDVAADHERMAKAASSR